MTLRTYDFEQGSDEWHDARRGIITASVVGKLITPKTAKPALNDDTRALTMHLIAERITGYTEPTYMSADMERGKWDEPIARDIYSEQISPVTECGFMVRNDWGWKIGYSPDGLVGDDGLIEVKSRRQKTQLKTILEDAVPLDVMAQLQCGLLVSGRKWVDYISFCGGMPMYIKRVHNDRAWQETILEVVAAYEATAAITITKYENAIIGLPLTERDNLFEEMRL